jgi:hypothetical protein
MRKRSTPLLDVDCAELILGKKLQDQTGGWRTDSRGAAYNAGHHNIWQDHL